MTATTTTTIAVWHPLSLFSTIFSIFCLLAVFDCPSLLYLLPQLYDLGSPADSQSSSPGCSTTDSSCVNMGIPSCGRHGRCHGDWGSFSCQCEPGHSGHQCDEGEWVCSFSSAILLNRWESNRMSWLKELGTVTSLQEQKVLLWLCSLVKWLISGKVWTFSPQQSLAFHANLWPFVLHRQKDMLQLGNYQPRVVQMWFTCEGPLFRGCYHLRLPTRGSAHVQSDSDSTCDLTKK